jgi:hypothetical protein
LSDLASVEAASNLDYANRRREALFEVVPLRDSSVSRFALIADEDVRAPSTNAILRANAQKNDAWSQRA